jgi:hypothetical protein
MKDWRSIDTAPRDGTIVEVMDPDCGTFQMRWNPAGHNPIFQREYGNGIWECPGNNFTWRRTKAPDLAIGDPSHLLSRSEE